MAYDRLHTFGREAYAFILKKKMTKLALHAPKCIFLGYGTNGDFSYRQCDPENRKLIRSKDAVFNEDFIFSYWNQQKIVGKKVSFEDDRAIVEGLTHQVESEIQQTVKLKQADNTSADSESTIGSIVAFKDKAIKVKSTRVDKGLVSKMLDRDRNGSTKFTGRTMCNR